MNLIKKLTTKQIDRKNYYLVPSFKVGDTLHVRMYFSKKDKRKQTFSGVCIAKPNKGYQSSFTLVNLIYGQTICKTIPLYTKLITNIQVIPSKRKSLRAKLYSHIIKKQIR
jgi:large subunit ribosomal protein L19